MEIQVKPEHYKFNKYMTRRRWRSLWHALNLSHDDEVNSILEVGPGPGLYASLMRQMGFSVSTADIDIALEPDFLIKNNKLPIDSNSFDLVCAFQVLEHMEFSDAMELFSEMSRVCKKKVIISLPNLRPAWPVSIHIPFIGEVNFLIKRPWTSKEFNFNGQHYWELSAKNYSVDRVIAEFCSVSGMSIKRHFQCLENPYHHFMVFAYEK